MVQQAVIQAGGKGTRLGNLTKEIPKPMVEVAGKPVLEHQLQWCFANGISDVIIIVNHLGGRIRSFVKERAEKYSLPRVQIVEEPIPLGTAGMLPAIKDQLDDHFWLLYGDVIFDIDAKKLLDFHFEKKADATLLVHPNDHPQDSDLLEIDADCRVSSFHSKPHDENRNYRNLVNAALYLMSKNLVDAIEPNVSADFGKDIFPKALSNYALYGYSTSEYVKDMGTLDRIEKVGNDILSGKVERRNLQSKQKAIFLDRDGVINYDTDLIHRPEDFTLYPFAAQAIQRINKSDYLSVVTTNQSIIARNLTDLDGLQSIHDKMETELGREGAFLDAIYFCPHHPHGGFLGENPLFKVVCDCRKPKPGMIMQARERFNIDLRNAWMIGDSERDMGAGKAAGVRTIAVKTGHGIIPSILQPDLFFANLKEAVDFILDQPLESAVNQLMEAIGEGKKCVLIAGNSRSGKSHLSQCLQWELEKEDRAVFKIQLDDWILPKEERIKDSNVFQNFRFERLEEDILRILKGEKVVLPGYPRHPKRKAQEVIYQYQNEEIVLIEGVVALSSPQIRALADLKVFVFCEEAERKARMKVFYDWKGYSESAFEQLYSSRIENEYQLIEKEAYHADLHIQT